MVTALVAILMWTLLSASLISWMLILIAGTILPEDTQDRLKNLIGKKVEKWIDKIES